MSASVLFDDLLQDINHGTPSDNVVVSWNDVTSSDNYDVVTDSRGIEELAVVGILLILLIVVTVLGNLLVCVTVLTNRRMHNITNYFLVSLASSDLLLGLFVLPFSAVNTLGGPNDWPLGAAFCNVYCSTDVMLCTVSILTLFAISLDRYFAVTAPFRYQSAMRPSVVWKVSAAIWSFSFVMAFLPIHLGWNTPDGHLQNYARPNNCTLALNGPYVLIVALGTYFAPLLIVCAVYVRVLQITRQQVKEINSLTQSTAVGRALALKPSLAAPSSPLPAVNPVTSPLVTPSSRPSIETRASPSHHNISPPIRSNTVINTTTTQAMPSFVEHVPSNSYSDKDSPTISAALPRHKLSSQPFPASATLPRTRSVSHESITNQSYSSCKVVVDQGCSSSPSKQVRPVRASLVIHNGATASNMDTEVPTMTTTSQKQQRHRRIVSDRKATVNLASVVLAFAICWVPYFVLFTAKPFLPSSIIIPTRLDLFCLWLGYANSSINPFIYAFYYTTFRDGFRRLLLCRDHDRCCSRCCCSSCYFSCYSASEYERDQRRQFLCTEDVPLEGTRSGNHGMKGCLRRPPMSKVNIDLGGRSRDEVT